MPLFFDSTSDALRAIVQVLGGYKKVAAQMRPELPADTAAKWLTDCLNPERREKLDPDQFLLLLRLARQAGYHQSMAYVASEVGYEEPRPIEPQDQFAALQREFVNATKVQAQILERMERLAGPVRAVK
jgi:hypothetical protein